MEDNHFVAANIGSTQNSFIMVNQLGLGSE